MVDLQEEEWKLEENWRIVGVDLTIIRNCNAKIPSLPSFRKYIDENQYYHLK